MMPTLTIRSHRLRGHFFLVLGVALFASAAVLFNGWRTGRYSLVEWLALGLMGLYMIFHACKLYSTILTYANGTLTLKKFYGQQTVNLEALVMAKKYMFPIGKYPDQMLKLVDEGGKSMRIDLDDFDFNDLGRMADSIRPFIFVPRVDKNFTSFEYHGAPDTPNRNFSGRMKVSFGMFGKAVLFVLVPALIITGAVVVWAIFTKQPAFR